MIPKLFGFQNWVWNISSVKISVVSIPNSKEAYHVFLALTFYELQDNIKIMLEILEGG